jgi:formylmethanofuran dehydrogenase subunit E
MVTVFFVKDESERKLPQPRYEHRESDPVWLETVVRFHGHLGPSIIAGARLGMAGIQAVDAKGYFDVEVTCEGPFVKPPQSCFLDGLQIGTGATLGKRNLNYVEAKEIVVRVKNTTSGATVEVRPTRKLLEMLGILHNQEKNQAKDTTHQHDEADRIETVAREIANMPDGEIFTVKATP